MRAFTIIEIVFVIVVISILSIFINPDFNKQVDLYIDGVNQNRKVSQELLEATNQVLSHIRYTRHLALIDNKFVPYRLNSSVQETSRSKYWFKAWWQIYFSYANNNTWYTIFRDIPTNNGQNFDGNAHLPSTSFGEEKQFAKDPLTKKYMIGYCDAAQYPSCNVVNQNLNLTKKFGINYLQINNTLYANGDVRQVRILFDNMGRAYFREGDNSGNSNLATDINPYEFSERKILRELVKLTLCKNNPCDDNNISICIEPETGYSYICP